ncbi:MAG: xanthine dehydrogenase family protein subunit M [Elusimicrobiota bacterium]
MAIAHEFAYHKPKTLEEAVKLLGGFKGSARVLAGGTDLIGWIRDGLIAPDALIDLKGIEGLDRIENKNGVVRVGALATFNALRESPVIRTRLPLLWEAAGMVASCGLRNRATMVGNICSAVPCCDSGPVLLAYEAQVALRGKGGGRKVPVGEWFVANKKTAIREGEIVTGVEIPVPARHGACYVKLGRYRGEDLAQVSVAVVALPGQEYRVAFGAVAAKPLRARKVENSLRSKGWADSVKRLVPEEISPITDIRSTKEYRVHMAQIMLARGVRAAVSRLAGKGPAYGTKVI